jgi:hypothetical protein
MLMAALAVSAFFATDFILFVAHMGWLHLTGQTELVEFIGDIATASLLAVTFTMRRGPS